MRKKSFAEILAEAKAANPNSRTVDFANWEPQEEFRDQAGFDLMLVGEVTPARARQLVLDGAALASDDGCGCPGCGIYPPLWIDPDRARSAAKKSEPVLGEENECGIFLEHWRNTGGDVVIAHAHVGWLGALD